MTLQPSEFAKAATALAVSKFISDLNTDLKFYIHQVKVILIITMPAVLVVLQNDTGWALVYVAFYVVFYREGIPRTYLILGVLLALISVSSLKFGDLV